MNTVAPVNAGISGSNTVCSNGSTFSLIDFLSGNPQTGGAWTGPSTVVGGVYDPNSMNPGVYTYTVTATSPCPNGVATVTVTETPATLWYADQDGDNAGDPNTSLAACTT